MEDKDLRTWEGLEEGNCGLILLLTGPTEAGVVVVVDAFSDPSSLADGNLYDMKGLPGANPELCLNTGFETR